MASQTASAAIAIRYPHSGYLLCTRMVEHERCSECVVDWRLPDMPRSHALRVVNSFYWNKEKQRVEWYDGKGQPKCEHKRRVGKCTKCGTGSELCACGKDNWSCEIHGIGKGRCVAHGKLKATCREEGCGNGYAFCHHKNKKGKPQRRDRCKECGGSELCKCGRNKNRCIDCGGKEVCKHKQWFYTCPHCPGPGACKHKGSKYNCDECDGSQRCGHDLRTDDCYRCTRKPEKFCSYCKFTLTERSSYKPLCASCHYYLHPDVVVPTRYLLKQHYINAFIREKLKLEPLSYDRVIPDACSRYRPDWFYDLGTHVVFLECDEHGHRGYSCENKRLMALFQDAGNRPTVMIRFNPDDFERLSCFRIDSRNIIHPVPEVWDRRSGVLLSHLIHHLENVPDKEVTVIHLYYKGTENPVVEMDNNVKES